MKVRAELEAEAERLLSFAAPAARLHQVQIVRWLTSYRTDVRSSSG